MQLVHKFVALFLYCPS